MSGATTELNLATAVDSDDNADYLTLSLANSLRTVDGLFNNITGHTHGGAHQGGPLSIPAGSITSAQIADGTIATADLANASVTNAKLGSDTARASLLVNGGFEIWQRGNGPFTANGVHLADRWDLLVGSGDSISISKDTTNQDTGSVACAALTYTHGSGQSGVFQDLKIADPHQLRGKTLSASVRVKSTTASTCVLTLTGDGTGVASVNSSANTAGGYQTLTAAGFVVPADATFVRIYILYSLSCTAYIDNAMLVVGSQYADYAPLHPADDMARCLRYYEVQGDGSYNFMLAGYGSGAGQGFYSTYRYTQKAVAPTVTKNGTWAVSNCGQPAIYGTPANGSYVLTTTTVAAGAANVAPNAAGQNVTLESNP
jgi:hypothetical protein